MANKEPSKQLQKQNSTGSKSTICLTKLEDNEKLKNKIKFVTTMLKMQKTLREQSEEII